MITQILAIVRGNENELELALADLLETTLFANQNDFDDETVVAMVRLIHLRECSDPGDGNGPMRLAGFEIDLPDEVQYPERIVGELVSTLGENAPFTHAVRFEDETLRRELAERAAEIFAVEMKLRRALTYVYLYAYYNGSPFDLLVEETVRPMPKEAPKPEHMRTVGENTFFYLTFSQYVGLNSRPPPKLDGLLKLISECANFEGVRDELARQPIQQEEDAVFLAGLKSRMESIEAMRNCVAHNRRPTRKVSEDYQQAYPELDAFLDQYLHSFSV